MVTEGEAGEEREQGLRHDVQHAVEQADHVAALHAADIAAAQEVCAFCAQEICGMNKRITCCEIVPLYGG